MKAGAALVALGLVCLMVQTAIARAIPPPWCPDLAWLVVVGMGLRWPHWLSGVWIAVGLGYATDLLSGSLLGQHALLRGATFLSAMGASRQLDLSGGLPLAMLTFALSLVYGLATAGILALFVGTGSFGWPVLADSWIHAMVNAFAAAPLLSQVERVLDRWADEEVGRRGGMRVGLPRGGVA